MTRKRKDKRFCLICFLLVALFFCCTNEKQSNSDKSDKEDYMFEELDLNYSICIRNGLNTIYFLSDRKKNIINVLIYKEKQLVNELTLKVGTSNTTSFVNIVKKQIEFEKVFNKNKNKKGFEIVFCVGLNTNELSASYPHVINYKDEISFEFYELISFLKKNKLVNDFFDAKK